MRYNHKDADNILLPEGIVDFQIVHAADTTSKGGDEMIKLTIRVWSKDGTETTVFDYLLAKKNMLWKLKHLCEAVGLEKKFESDEIEASDFMSKSGKLKLRIDKSENPAYPDKNVVADYIKASDVGHEEKQESKEEFEDEIPF